MRRARFWSCGGGRLTGCLHRPGVSSMGDRRNGDSGHEKQEDGSVQAVEMSSVSDPLHLRYCHSDGECRR